MRVLLVAGMAALVVGLPQATRAGTFGVPTNLNADGTLSAASIDPPGWFTLTGTGAANTDGDSVHQLRLFIEVTGTTLDVLVFDPGRNGARDLVRGTAVSTTTFTLFDPAGGTVKQIANFGNDTSSTTNRLARFPTGAGTFCVPNNPNPGTCSSFSGLNPGLYEFRITMTGLGTADDDEVNAFGVDIRVARDNAAHYNVYTVGDSAAPDTAMVIGAINSGTSPFANITQRMVFFPYVNRGCSLQTSNYDMDTGAGNAGAGSVGDITDVARPANVTALTMSGSGGNGGGDDHAEDTVVIEDATATNLASTNYGMYALTNDTGTQQNLIDWRVADFQGWSDDPTTLPRDPANPIRMYLPNGYTPPIPPNANAIAPFEPTLGSSAVVVDGANPPAVGQTTRFALTASVDNPTAAALTNVQITIGQPANVVYVGGTQAGFIGGAPAACTDGSGVGFRRCTFASLPAGSNASLSIEVDYLPLVAGLNNLTGPPLAGSPPPNTTVWAQYAPAFSSSTFPRTEVVGPVCNLVAATGGADLVTRATIRGLRVDPAGVIEFAAAQKETVAFNLYATGDREARRGGILLNAAPIRAPVPDSAAPILYRVETAPITLPYLMIEEIDRRGRRHVMGPFAIGDERLRAGLERIERAMDEAGAPRGGHVRFAHGGRDKHLFHHPARGHHARRRSLGQAIKIEVTQPGLVEVPYAELEALGLPPRTPLRRLRLTSQGEEVTFQVRTDRSGTPSSLLFRAERLSTDYTGSNVYVLSWGGPPPRLSVRLTRSDVPRDPAAVRVEQNNLYVPSVPEDTDPWLWDILFGDGSSWPPPDWADEGTFDLEGLRSGTGDVPVRIRFTGLTSHRHTVEAEINGALVGTLTFTGATAGVLEGHITADALQAAGNHLTLTYSASGGSPGELGLVYLNNMDLAVEVDPPAAPVTDYVLAPFDARVPDAGGADYLIVTHGDFREQADRMAGLKAAAGLRPVVVDVERAYDRFSAGIVEANAVRALIRENARRGRLRYVLLVGGDTFDPRDYIGTGIPSFIPSLLAWDGEFGRIPSENRYADVDGDGSPDLAIGRLPVQTPEEAAVIIDKMARAAPPAPGRHLFAVDNQAPGDASFRSIAEEAAAALPPGSTAIWADLGQGIESAREVLLSTLRGGALTATYSGHGGPEIWADEWLLTVDDIPALADSGNTTILFAWDCESQWYQNLTSLFTASGLGRTINEALLLVPNGGTRASFGPVGISDPALQRQLVRRVYTRFLKQGLSLGEAIRRAKAEALAADPATRPVVEGFGLLGDPALVLSGGSVRP